MLEKNDIMQLSDYSFLERSVHDVYIWIWFIVHVWRCDRFSSLNWKRIISLELKSFVTIFILIALPLGSFYDIVTTKITYFEGFYRFPDNAIRSKPKWLWSQDDQLWYIPSYYILMVGLSLQTVTLFLLQCFWNYLTNSIAKTSFMSRGEFAFYIVWGIVSVAIYPILPYVLSNLNNSELYQESLPQLVYATQLLILVLLGIRTHTKFHGLIELTSSYKNSANIIAKLRYFIDMNKLLTTSLAVTSVAFYLLSIDLLTSAKLINKSKIASDLLVAHVNFASLIEWLTLILIFYPRKGFVGTGAGGSTFNTNLGSVPSVNPTPQSSYSNSVKLNNVPPGTGTGVNINNERRQKPPSIVDVNQANNFQTTIKSVPISPDYDNVNNNSDTSENSQKPSIQKQSSFKRFKKKPTSSTPLSDSNSDLSNSENDGNKPVYLKRNISISKDGKMVYGETKPLGKVKGTEFVAVEKADPSFIPSYYFSNELKDRDGNVFRIPSILNDQKFRYEIDADNDAGISSSTNSNSSNGVDQQGIKQVDMKQKTIEPRHSTIQENVVENGVNDRQNSDDDSSDDEFFYAM